MGEKEFKEGMVEALKLIEGKTEQTMLKARLREAVIRRADYVKRKLSGCMGYSDVEKKARVEELNYILCRIEEIFE